MKNLILSLMAIALIAVTPAKLMAQGDATASATATATIVTPIAISSDVQMNFGILSVNATPGTVVLLPAGTTSSTGGVTLPASNPGTITAATFDVTGQDGYTYAITLPSSDYTITRTGNSETMVVNTFTSSPSGTGTLTGGSETVKVGATLNVGANQVAGTYTNATGFDVTVDYN